MNLNQIYQKAEAHERLSTEEGLLLAEQGDFLKLAELANKRAKHINGNKVAYLIDCNINYTNICKTHCKFCAFYRPKGQAEAWELSFAELDQKIQNAVALGGSRILLQGGIHPDYRIEDYERLIAHIHKNHKIHIHAFSPSEIDDMAKTSGLSNTDVLKRLCAAGLKSIPGGGAEILVDEIRKQISPQKLNSQEWLDVMAAAHKLGIKTTATMMIGHVENWTHRLAHLRKLRDLQDKTEGFISFIAWSFQPENTHLHNNVNLTTAHEYLKLVAIARLFLDNVPHIQASTLTQGDKVAQIALNFGADDIGSIMIEEQVVAAAGCDGVLIHTKEDLIKSIVASGHEPYQRDTMYQPV